MTVMMLTFNYALYVCVPFGSESQWIILLYSYSMMHQNDNSTSSKIRSSGLKSLLYNVVIKLTEFFSLGSCKYKDSNLPNIELLKDTHILTYMIKFVKFQDEEKIF